MDETIWDRDARAVAAAILTNQRGPKNDVPDAKSVASYAAVVATELEGERRRRYQERVATLDKAPTKEKRNA